MEKLTGAYDHLFEAKCYPNVGKSSVIRHTKQRNYAVLGYHITSKSTVALVRS